MPKDPQANHTQTDTYTQITFVRFHYRESMIDPRFVKYIRCICVPLHQISDVSRTLYYLSAETNCVYLGIRVLVLAVQRLILLSRRVNVFTRLWCVAATWTPVHVVVRLTSNVVWQMNKHMWLNSFVFDLSILNH